MTKEEYEKLIELIRNRELKNIDIGRLDGKREDVVRVADAIAIINMVYYYSINLRKGR